MVNNMNNKQILAIMLIIIGVTSIIGLCYYSYIEYDNNLGTVKQIEVSCYDRHNNEIIGLTCESEVIDEYDIVLIIGTPLSILLTFVSFIMLWFATSGQGEQNG